MAITFPSLPVRDFHGATRNFEKLGPLFPLTSAYLGANSVGALQIGSLPACRVYNSANLPCVGATLTTLTFDSERFDTNSCHSTSANISRLTCNTAGVYVPFFTGQWGASALGYRSLAFLLNGTTYIGGDRMDPVQTAASVTLQSLSAPPVKLAVGDYIEAQAYQTSGGTINIEANAQVSPEFGWVWYGDG